jgi:hypothetical protein
MIAPGCVETSLLKKIAPAMADRFVTWQAVRFCHSAGAFEFFNGNEF